MSTDVVTQSAVRLSFQLGPWGSPGAAGWRAAYDALVAGLAGAGGRVYGVLEADLGGGQPGTAAWRNRFVANAAGVIARYGDRIPAFEVLPGPNRPAPDGSPGLGEQVFGRVLAAVYATVKGRPRGRDVELVAGALAPGEDGPGYLAGAIRAARASGVWAALPGLHARRLPMDAVAIWPELPPAAGPIPPGSLDGQIAALLAALGPFDEEGALRVYVSGLARRAGARGDCAAGDVEAALDELRRSQPRVRIAAREAADGGPRYATPEEPQAVSPTFAIFGIPERRALSVPAQFASPVEAPAVDGFDFPVGRRDAPHPSQAGYAMTTTLVDPGYYEKFNNAWHPGEDWAAYGPCDAGLGAPVYAVADGVVACRNYFTPNWGNIMLVRHTLRSGAAVWSQYAHLDTCLVDQNALVRRGQEIGAIGKGAGDFCAHLHFEMRPVDARADEWLPLVRDKNLVLANRLPPEAFIRGHRPGGFGDCRGIIVNSAPGQQPAGAFARTETPGHWLRSYFGWNDTADFTFASQVEIDWGEWRPQLPAAARYDVQAWIPSRHATTKNAVYTVHHAAGTAEHAVDQSACNDQWVSLGTYDFAAQGALVRLTDKTGEKDGDKLEVCFDAVRWLAA